MTHYLNLIYRLRIRTVKLHQYPVRNVFVLFILLKGSRVTLQILRLQFVSNDFLPLGVYH